MGTTDEKLKGRSSHQKARTTGRKVDADPIDIYVGGRLRVARTLKGLSQECLGRLECLSFQQVQKYEMGINRISASRLARFAGHLGMRVEWFFEGMERAASTSQETSSEIGADVLCNPETLKLVQTYYRIKDERKRKAVIRFFKVLERG